MLNSHELKTVQAIVRSIIREGGADFDLLSALTPEDKAQVWASLKPEQRQQLIEIGKQLQKQETAA